MILQKIIDRTRARLELEKEMVPLKSLFAANPKPRKPLDFKAAFAPSSAPRVIAEVKLASPSEGDIAPDAEPVEVASDYLSQGAAALSVLTELDFFKGHPDYLSHIRQAHAEARLLMKDFFVDEYQLAKALVFGADAILIILAALSPNQAAKLMSKAGEYGLTSLVEVHDEQEFKAALDLGATLIGVNNRNLKTMEVSLRTSETLARLAPPSVTLISESGIKTADDIRRLSTFGFKGFLVGTELMRSGSPGKALSKLLGARG